MKHLVMTAIVGISLALFSAGAQSTVVVQYDIANSNPSVSSSVNALPAPVGVIPSAMVATAATLGTPAPWTGAFEYSEWHVGVAPDPTQYYEFTVTPAAGYQVQYQSIDLGAIVSGNPSSDWTMAVHASLDGFGASDIALFTQAIARDGSAHIFNGLDISALGTQSGAVTFRFYMYRPAGSQSGFAGLLNFGAYGPDKSFFVNGIVTPPPLATEPTTWGGVKALYR